MSPRAGLDTWFLLKADIELPDEELRWLRDPHALLGPPDSAIIARGVACAARTQIAALEPEIDRGTFHWIASATLADGRHVIGRINRLRHPALRDSLVVEARLPSILAVAGVATPAVLGIDLDNESLPGEIMVRERLDGVTLAALDSSEPVVLRNLRSVGTVLRQVHDIQLPGAGPLEVGPHGGLTGRFEDWKSFIVHRLDDHLRQCFSIGAMTEADARRARLILFDPEDDRPTNRLLHGDPGPANVLSRPDGSVRLLDWEDALVGDPVFDLASAAAFHPERRWPALFEGYGWSPSEPDNRRFWRYMLRIALARTVMRHRFAIPDVPGRPTASGRIRRALEQLQLEEVP